jgi:thiol-disulfide isomerase/thioredoxin
MRALVLAVVLLISGVAAAGVLNVGDRLAELDVGVDGGGKPVKLKSLKGKWVVVSVGASWCKPCKKELPTWDRLAGVMGDKVVFVSINVDNNPQDGQKFNSTLKLKNMKLVYLPADKSAVAERYGSDTMPTTFVFNPDQVLKYRKDGFQERDADGEKSKLQSKLHDLMGK